MRKFFFVRLVSTGVWSQPMSPPPLPSPLWPKVVQLSAATGLWALQEIGLSRAEAPHEVGLGKGSSSACAWGVQGGAVAAGLSNKGLGLCSS